MKLGVLIPLNLYSTPELIHALGTTAESLGFDSLWIGEHVVITDNYEANYPVSEDGQMPLENVEDNVELDIFTSLAYLAAHTSRIRLGSAICVLPQRNPVYTAKEAGNVDWLSNGRLLFGVGLGWMAEEFKVVSAPFEQRGARTRSYIEVIKRLWCDPVSEYHDDFYDLPPCRFYPKPVQRPHPPIILAGNSRPNFRRVAEQGQGWFAIGANPEQLAPQLENLEAALAEAGRPREEISVYVCPFDHEYDREMIRQYHELGVDELVLLHYAKSPEQVKTLLNNLAQQYLEFVRSLQGKL
jgi:probable F420-dependent oxidoreductase